jgi:Flp pilus assembly protein TadD, contains TPR repeats
MSLAVVTTTCLTSSPSDTVAAHHNTPAAKSRSFKRKMLTKLYRILERRLRVSLTVLALSYALFAGIRTTGDPDLGWQLATGRWIVQHHIIPFGDVLSYTAVGHEWVYPVLSQVIFYSLFRLGGYSLLSWCSAAACVATTVALLRGSSLNKFLAVLAVPIIAFRTAPRAEMFTQMFFVVFVWILWQHHRSGHAPLWSLPMLMFLWVNLHLGFVSGLGMCAAYIFLELGETLAAERRRDALNRLRTAWPWLLATLAATFLNPWGARNYVGMFRLLPVQSSSWIVELQHIPVSSGSITQAVAWRDPRSAFWCMLLIAVIAILTAALNRRFAPAIILAVSIFLVFHSTRFQGLFAGLAVIVGGSVITGGISWNGWQHFRTKIEHSRPVLTVSLLMIVAAIVGVRISDLVTNRYYLRTPYQFSLFGPGESDWYPEEAASFLKSERLPKNVFSNYNLGGFAAWRLLPEYPDYVDGRGGPFGAEVILRSFELVSETLDSPLWQQEASARNINTVMVSVDHELGEGLSGLQKFCTSERWRPVYLDTKAALFVRVSPDTAEPIRRLQIDCNKVKFDSPPNATNGSRSRAERFLYYRNAGGILVVLNRDVDALSALAQAQQIYSENAFLHYAKGAALESMANSFEAEAEFRDAITLDSEDAAVALARLYDDQGRFIEEAAVLTHAAEQSSQPHWLYIKLGYAQLAIGSPRLALRSFDQAEKTSPFGNDPVGASFQTKIAEGRRRANEALR